MAKVLVPSLHERFLFREREPMKRVEIVKTGIKAKIGQPCPQLPPTVKDDCYLYHDGELIGFYLRQMPKAMCQFANFANTELLSDRVPKSLMTRSSKLSGAGDVEQYSTIIGSIPPKANFKRGYAAISSVHRVASAQTFIKAMQALVGLGEKMIQQLAPELYERQERIIAENVPERYRFSRLYTSSISNFNISAPYHRDTANLKPTVNIIIGKKKDSIGGNLVIPEYAACVEMVDNAMLVYPAWRDIHGVSPIMPLKQGGYRNSLVFYPLNNLQHGI